MKCDVVIPVGPGHQEVVHRAINSVAMAERYSKGPFDEVDVIAIDDTQGEHGRSKARNEAVAKSEADWIFFLDADDLMHIECFVNLDHAWWDWEAHQEDYDAIWGRIVEYREGIVLDRYQVSDITKYEDLLFYDPYLTLQIGHFVKRDVALNNPFDVSMNTGEDWDYYLRLWEKHNCIKIDHPFMCNIRGEHSKGPRSSNGQEWREVVEGLIDARR